MGSVQRTEWLIWVEEPSKSPADHELKKQESVRDGKGKIGQQAWFPKHNCIKVV